jgi:hypothetical protein
MKVIAAGVSRKKANRKLLLKSMQTHRTLKLKKVLLRFLGRFLEVAIFQHFKVKP